jgi:hypothetical protein
VADRKSHSDWVFGLSLVQVMLLVLFAAMLVYMTGNGEGRGQETLERPQKMSAQDGDLVARLDAAVENNAVLEKRLKEMALLVDEVQLMAGAKTSSKEAFQEAIDSLKRGYALCRKDDNTLIEASIQHGAETVQVVGEVPSDLTVNLVKGEQTSDLEEIVSFIQDVYEYEKDHKCRFNYRLKYATDNDYKKGRDGYEKYFYPEKIIKAG